MPAPQSFFWVNKTRNSSSLSNCRNDTGTFRQLHSHALVIGHKTSRVKRSVVRRPFHLSWGKRGHAIDEESPLYRSRPSSTTPNSRNTGGGDGNRARWTSAVPRRSPRARTLPQHNRSDLASMQFEGNICHLGSGLADPFSSCAIQLDAAAVDGLWYFENMWAQCAFKIPGCVGYGQAPVQPWEITALIRGCLLAEDDGVHASCLLAGASARKQYLHHRHRRACFDGGAGENSGSSVEQQLAHMYARRALRGLNQRLLVRQQNSTTTTATTGNESIVNKISEQEATDILFLAAYETFCEDIKAAATHLTGVRRLCNDNITNTFVSRLQANLELLALKH